MSRGVLLFAHNSIKTNYFDMALYTAKRVNKYLDLPVTIVTDTDSLKPCDHNVIIEKPNKSNYRDKDVWINKGRCNAFDYSPYDETLLLDVDYLINSNRLLNTFEYNTDFVCYLDSRYILENHETERLHRNGIKTCWATVVRFNKTKRCSHIFKMMNMVEDNNEHYSKIYRYVPNMFRNDYALTIALKTINNHVVNKSDYIDGNLLHVGKKVYVERLSDTEYKIYKDVELDSIKTRQYIKVKDIDFHMMNKSNFLELTYE